jgi:antirestriction protein ArdC
MTCWPEKPADLGITPENRRDHDDYIGNWLQVLKYDIHGAFLLGPKKQT